MSPRALTAVAAAAVLVASCAEHRSSTETVAVFAASSLSKTFTTIGEEFTAAHPATQVLSSFAGSADLLAQLDGGARADVLATADTATMDRARAAGLIEGQPVAFATNTLTIAVPAGNPQGVRSFRDLSRVTVVVCAPQVPCGAAVRGVESATGTPLNPVSEESAVADVAGKVTSGQADAGIVYATDIRSSGGRLIAVPLPEAAGAVNTYHVAVVAGSANPGGAQQFIAAVSGPRGREILAEAGFGPP